MDIYQNFFDTPECFESVVMHLVRSPKVVQRAAEIGLTAEDFRLDKHWGDVTVFAFADIALAVGDAPISRSLLASHVKFRVESGELDEVHRPKLESFASQIYNGELNEQYFTDNLVEFLKRRRIIKLQYRCGDDLFKFVEEGSKLKDLGAGGIGTVFDRASDLETALSDEEERERPSVGQVFANGQSLFYAAALNEIHAEPEVGKSNVALATAVNVLKAGGRVWHLDPEDNVFTAKSRMRAFGASDDEMRAGYTHWQAPTQVDYAELLEAAAGGNVPNLLIVDGMAETLGSFGVSENDNDEVVMFIAKNLRPFAHAGAAVLILDHVVKNSANQGRFARGAGAKLGAYDGAVFEAERVSRYGPRIAGSIRLKVAKDRKGGLDAGQSSTYCEVKFTPNGDKTVVEFDLKSFDARFWPEGVARKVIDHVHENPGCTKTEVRKCGSKAQYVDLCVDGLKRHGFLRVERVGTSDKHYVEREYCGQDCSGLPRAIPVPLINVPQPSKEIQWTRSKL